MGWNKWWIKRRYDNGNIRFKTTTIRASLCDYSEAYIPVKGIKTVPNKAAAGAQFLNITFLFTLFTNVNKKVIFKNCAPFTIAKWK